MKIYDVIVVGAGLAGLMAARNLKTRNYLVIDKKKEIGLPLKCAEGTREREFLKLFGTKDFPFVRNTVHYHEIVYEDVKRVVKVPYLQLDRPKFEKWLAKGLKIKLDTKLEDVDVKHNFVELITDKGKLYAKLIVIANGCNFKIQRKYNLFRGKPILVPGYGGIYKDYNLNKDRFYFFFDKKGYKGYLCIFPKTKTLANICFGGVNLKENIKQVLNKLLKKYNLKPKLVRSYSGVFPCMKPLKKTYYKRMLFCGDAAGQVYAGTGEGICFALYAGKLAANTINNALKCNRFDEKFLKNYEKDWKSAFGKCLKGGFIFYKLLEFGLRYKILKRLFLEPTDKELKQMILDGKIPLRARLVYHLTKFF